MYAQHLSITGKVTDKQALKVVRDRFSHIVYALFELLAHLFEVTAERVSRALFVLP